MGRRSPATQSCSSARRGWMHQTRVALTSAPRRNPGLWPQGRPASPHVETNGMSVLGNRCLPRRLGRHYIAGIARESGKFPPHHRAARGPLPSCANGQGRSKSAAGAGPKVRHLSTRQQRIVGGGLSRRADCKRVASAVCPADPRTRCRRRPMRIKPHRAARSGRCAVEFVPQQFGFVDAVTEREGLEVGLDYFRAG